MIRTKGKLKASVQQHLVRRWVDGAADLILLHQHLRVQSRPTSWSLLENGKHSENWWKLARHENTHLHFFRCALKQQSGSHLCINTVIDPCNGSLSLFLLIISDVNVVPNKSVKDSFLPVIYWIYLCFLQKPSLKVTNTRLRQKCQFSVYF